jgi:SAM-dependent methyltransferase
MKCPICSRETPPSVTPWTFHCRVCDYWGSSLQPVTENLKKDDFLTGHDDGDNPISYLDELRIRNFETILESLACLEPKPLRLLEVGCGSGLFLECAEKRGFAASGIEAYAAMAAHGIRKGRRIQVGLFPDCLDSQARFDGIVFNDVFEHLPDAPNILRLCWQHLNPGGVLVINLPNSRGLFFRIARLSCWVGCRGPWERLWQKMFFTPHLHYFSARSLQTLCTTFGFVPISSFRGLRSFSMRGLWARISADDKTTVLQRAATWTAALALSVVVPFFPSDCAYQIFRKPSDSPQ